MSRVFTHGMFEHQIIYWVNNGVQQEVNREWLVYSLRKVNYLHR